MFISNSDWYGFPGAKESEIEKLVQAVDIDLPAEYLDLLRFSDGGETEIAVQPWNFVLDDVQSVLKFHKNDFFPGYFIFGGNGGGELFAIDKELMPLFVLIHAMQISARAGYLLQIVLKISCY